jgi:hypothetical protein
MKKLAALLIFVIGLIIYLYPIKNKSSSNDVENKQNEFASEISISKEIFPYSNKKFASQKLKELTIANAQCKERNLDFTNQVNNIHQILIQVLEYELRSGKTERELLGYSNQYKTFYSGYDDLLLQAKINIEKEKYKYTNSVEILNDWSGLSVINGFSAIKTPIIVQGFKAFEGKSSGLRMTLKLKTEISRSDILDLLENTKSFNTYLESPLGISGSPVLSPSILFVLTAKQLDIDEFVQVASLQSFNVNDIAIAIKTNMPFEYLELLIGQTKSIEDMPLLVQGMHDYYSNLADLAASTYNIELLKLLAAYGVKPSNEPGIITGLDIAIMNLPNTPNAYEDLASFPDKYLNTINYLIKKGYKAHGSSYQIDDQTVISFKAPNRKSFQSSSALSKSLKQALHKIELLDSSYSIPQLSADSSLVSKAIETMEIRKSALNNKSKSCESIRKEMLSEEGFIDIREVYDLIRNIESNKENVAERLYEIDPVLVNLWRDTQTYQNAKNENTTSFINMLRDKKFQQALDYSYSKPLTEYETNTLLFSLLHNPENIIPIWNARVVHTQPSSFLAFKNLAFVNWELLINEGFDFSVKDKYGNDFFMPAALNSPEVVQLLLNNGYSPEFDKLGLDVLDILLDDSYEKGRLNPSLSLILSEIEELEPNHYSRIVRIRKFFPDEYEKLIQFSNKLIAIEGIEMNRFRLNNY